MNEILNAINENLVKLFVITNAYYRATLTDEQKKVFIAAVKESNLFPDDDDVQSTNTIA